MITRDSEDEEFDVPDGFVLVDINENNFRNYVSKIQHLLTEDISEKMMKNLVGFVKSDPESSKQNSETGISHLPTNCAESSYKCCPDKIHPQHGSQEYGCCASSEFGCCPDNLTPASAPYFDVTKGTI